LAGVVRPVAFTRHCKGTKKKVDVEEKNAVMKRYNAPTGTHTGWQPAALYGHRHSDGGPTTEAMFNPRLTHQSWFARARCLARLGRKIFGYGPILAAYKHYGVQDE